MNKWWYLIPLFAVSGCDLFTGPQSCMGLSIDPAIQVEVVDATTGGYLALDATGHVRKGEYQESVYRVSGLEERYLFANGNGPGRYDVFVEVEGYRPWSYTGAKAVEERCQGRVGLNGASLEARMVRE